MAEGHSSWTALGENVSERKLTLESVVDINLGMSWKGRSLLSIADLKVTEIDAILSLARQYKQKCRQSQMTPYSAADARVVAEVFFETSTRTRLSFQMASQRLGLRVLGMELMTGSSLAKGESQVETILNIAAMEPDALVIRSSLTDEIEACLRDLGIPAVNAGAGTSGHPTQALLDLMTLQEAFGDLKGKKLLFVGDIRHSRVANSNFELLPRYGVELAYCSPPQFAPQDPSWAKVQSFSDLSKGLAWCDAVMGLRVQEERHGPSGFDRDDYIRRFRLDEEHLSPLSGKGRILHPGPFKAGMDFSPELLSDPRCLIREQVSNGVYVRMAILSLILGLEGSN